MLNEDSIETRSLCQGFTVQDFLNHLFYGLPGVNYFELTLIVPPGVTVSGPHIITKSYRLGTEVPDWEWVQAMNARGYGIYYSLTPKKKRMPAHKRSSEDNTTYCQALWVDIDVREGGAYPDKDSAYTALCDHIPTVIIDSGGGLHGIWRIEPIEVTPSTLPHLKRTLRGLALALKADTSVAELARVFRLPGTVNTKPERAGALCHMVSFVPGQMDYDYFEEYRELAAPVVTVERDFIRHKPEQEPGYLSWYLDNAHIQGERNNALNWTAHKMYSDGYSESDGLAILLPKAITDGLEEDAVRKTIHSAFTGKRGAPSYVSKRGKLRMAAGDLINRLRGGEA